MWGSRPITRPRPARTGPGRSRISIWAVRGSSRPELPNQRLLRCQAAAAIVVAAFPLSRVASPGRSDCARQQDVTMKRREFLTLLGGAALVDPRAALAQTPGRIYHLGTLTPVAPMTDGSPFGKIVVKALAERGYAIGQNLTWDARGSMGDVAKIPVMLDELKARGVDAIIVIG